MAGKMSSGLEFYLAQVGEKLWVKPLLASMLSVAGVFAAKAADRTMLGDIVPEITAESIQSLLSIMASSVLVIASLAVASMVSAYASASTTASPRAFPLVVADDRTQNALSVFVATFIYSIIGLIASKNEYFGPGGRFVLFALTILVLMLVVLTFVIWVDRIARLGRMSATIKQVEHAAAKALRARRKVPFLGGHPLLTPSTRRLALFSDEVGFLQHIDMSGLQKAAGKANLRLDVMILPGTFVTPDREIVRYDGDSPIDTDKLRATVCEHFVISRDRTFTDDPRYGLIVLSQIAGHALSPAVNDPGTAIDVIGVLIRLLVEWSAPSDADEDTGVIYDHLSVPPLDADDMLDDAFTAIAREGAGTVEVMLRLLRALETLAGLGDPSLRAAALRHAKRALALAEREQYLPADRAIIEQRAAFRNA